MEQQPDSAEPFVELDEAEYRQHLARRALQVMKEDFDEKTWKACWQSVVEGRPAEAVGAELGMKPNAVYAAKFRVIRRLREELAGLLE